MKNRPAWLSGRAAKGRIRAEKAAKTREAKKKTKVKK